MKTYHSSFSAAALLGFCTWLLSACGFHMQGSVHLGPEFAHTYITGLEANDPLSLDLRNRIEQNGGAIAETVNEASAIIKLGQHNGKRVLSVSSDGNVAEYELYYKVTVEVQGGDRKVRLPSQTLVITRQVLFDKNAVLGNESEQGVLLSEMRRDMGRLVMLRLRALDGSQIPNGAPPTATPAATPTTSG